MVGASALENEHTWLVFEGGANVEVGRAQPPSFCREEGGQSPPTDARVPVLPSRPNRTLDKQGAGSLGELKSSSPSTTRMTGARSHRLQLHIRLLIESQGTQDELEEPRQRPIRASCCCTITHFHSTCVMNFTRVDSRHAARMLPKNKTRVLR